jgi:hypothetical protein
VQTCVDDTQPHSRHRRVAKVLIQLGLLLYLMPVPSLRQMLNLVKMARGATQGDIRWNG